MAVAAPWDRDAAYQALKAVADAATGITFVVANQPAPAPALPYGTFLVTGGPTPLYGNAVEHTTYDSSAAAGAEITRHTGGQATLAVSFQAFTSSAAADTSAISYLDKVAAYLQTEDARATLGNVGLALTAPAFPSDISAVVGAEFQSRAVLDAQFNLFLNIRTTTGYINNVILTADTVDDVDSTVIYNGSQTVTGS